MKHAVTMRRALSDPKLLGSALQGPSWATWRVFLIALMGEQLTEDERVVFKQFTGRDHEPGVRVEEFLALVGRRGGKDRAISVLATYLACFTDWTGVLARGEKGLVHCIGADVHQAKVQRDYIEGVFDSSPLLSRLVVNRTSDRIELSNQIVIETRAASFRRIRGMTAVAIIASEVAFWQTDEFSSNADAEILGAARPALSTTGGPLILITTPHARRGEVWSLYHRHYGPRGDPQILIAQGGSRDFNPTLSQRVVDRALERDRPFAEAEYLAQFRRDIESFVSREVVESCVAKDRRELNYAPGTAYTAFVDPSGGSADSMTLAVAHRGVDGHAILDVIRRVSPPFSPAQVVAEFSALLTRVFHIHKVTGDRYAGEFCRELFRSHGVAYELSEKPKSDIYRDSLALLNSGSVELLDDARLINELCGLERKVARSGKDSIDHMPNGHDDVCNSAMGALLLASEHSAVVISNDLLRRIQAMPKRREFGGSRSPRPMFGISNAPPAEAQGYGPHLLQHLTRERNN